MEITKFLSYFCPFSKKFHACKDFDTKLTGWQKTKTVALTILASIASLPLLGFGGVAVFRAMVEKYSFKKIVLPGGKKDHAAPHSGGAPSHPDPMPSDSRDAATPLAAPHPIAAPHPSDVTPRSATSSPVHVPSDSRGATPPPVRVPSPLVAPELVDVDSHSDDVVPPVAAPLSVDAPSHPDPTSADSRDAATSLVELHSGDVTPRSATSPLDFDAPQPNEAPSSPVHVPSHSRGATPPPVRVPSPLSDAAPRLDDVASPLAAPLSVDAPTHSDDAASPFVATRSVDVASQLVPAPSDSRDAASPLTASQQGDAATSLATHQPGDVTPRSATSPLDFDASPPNDAPSSPVHLPSDSRGVTPPPVRVPSPFSDRAPHLDDVASLLARPRSAISPLAAFTDVKTPPVEKLVEMVAQAMNAFLQKQKETIDQTISPLNYDAPPPIDAPSSPVHVSSDSRGETPPPVRVPSPLSDVAPRLDDVASPLAAPQLDSAAPRKATSALDHDAPRLDSVAPHSVDAAPISDIGAQQVNQSDSPSIQEAEVIQATVEAMKVLQLIVDTVRSSQAASSPVPAPMGLAQSIFIPGNQPINAAGAPVVTQATAAQQLSINSVLSNQAASSPAPAPMGLAQSIYIPGNEPANAAVASVEPSQMEQAVQQLEQAVQQLGQQLDDLDDAQVSTISSYMARFVEKLDVVAKAVGTQSDQPQDVKWKVLKYETIIVQLKMKFDQNLLLKKVKDHAAVSDSKDPKQIAKSIYDILVRVSLSADSKRFTLKYLGEMRAAYNEMLSALRAALTSSPDGNIYLQEFCKVLFTEIDLEQYCLDTLDEFDARGAVALNDVVSPASKGAHPLTIRLDTLYRRIAAVSYSAKAPLLCQWANSARGQWNCNFDPYGQGNPVHVLYSLYICDKQIKVGDKQVKALGMGTPTIEDWKSNARLSEEFVAFIRSYKDKLNPKKHLYVSNQNTMPKTDWKSYLLNGDETARSNLILDAQKRDDMKGAYYAIALSKNSHFYEQKHEYTAMSNALAFKKELYEQIFVHKREKSGCFIPDSLRKEITGFDEKCNKMMDAIHQHLFENKAELTVEERKIYIEMYYDMLTLMIIKELNVDSFNISCKDAIDRGAASNAQLFAHSVLAIIASLINDKYVLKKLERLMMIRAILVRKREPIRARVDRLCETLDYFIGHADGVKQLHKAVFGDTTIVPY